jgi:hypothetical protein
VLVVVAIISVFFAAENAGRENITDAKIERNKIQNRIFFFMIYSIGLKVGFFNKSYDFILIIGMFSNISLKMSRFIEK